MTRTQASVPPHASAQAALVQRRRQLLQQITQLDHERHGFDASREPELIEQGQELALASMLERLEEHDRAELLAIDAALARIANGDYGRCRSCGQAIQAARLQALPTAELCLPCASSGHA